MNQNNEHREVLSKFVAAPKRKEQYIKPLELSIQTFYLCKNEANFEKNDGI